MSGTRLSVGRHTCKVLLLLLLLLVAECNNFLMLSAGNLGGLTADN